MYIIRSEISQDGEYTSTFLKDKEGRDCRIGNWEGEIIAELQEKLSLLKAQNKRVLKDYDEAQDKLHRRNLQIKDLKKQREDEQGLRGKLQDFVRDENLTQKFLDSKLFNQ